jgi:hypothetical protein
MELPPSNREWLDCTVALVNKCRKLESIIVGGMRGPLQCFTCLRIISPALQIKSVSQRLNIATQVV